MRTPRCRLRAAWALVVFGFIVLVMVFGGPSRGAGAVPTQLVTTTPSTAPGSSVPGRRTTLPVPTTRSGTSTTVRPTATTARTRTVVPVPTTRYYSRSSATGPAPAVTTTSAATTTTILGIGGRVPTAPVTLPLHTTGSNGHVDPIFAWLSGIGFLVALLIVGVRLVITRAGGKDRAPLV